MAIRGVRKHWTITLAGAVGVLGLLGTARAEAAKGPSQPAQPLEFSGRYPDLAMFNHQGECGTGAVVPWAGRLWVITYAPHQPKGSDDKLYEIDADLNRVTRPESVGGTPADRMIHAESHQLIIGPYFIDEQRNVRVIPPEKMPARLTAVARHLTDPADRVYFYDMEGALFEADVHTLAVKKLFARVAPGAHGKGAYTGQGRLVVANNGNTVVNKATPASADPGYAKDPQSAGALAEWDGKTWRVLQRRQFTDVTGPGGINGSPDDASPLWAIGWDERSVMLELLDGGQWHTYRLPVGDYSYVAKHGWYTEWPRIREVAPGKLLMNMHGQWFAFPKNFRATQAGGIEPLGDYLKITGDFCGWKDRIVFGCDDASVMQNPLAGQSQSNLWFSTWDNLSHCGRPAGFGGPWVDDPVKANEPSDPYLFGGYPQRMVHLSDDADRPVKFTFEFDADGGGKWTTGDAVTVPPHGYAWYVFPANRSAQWVRVRTDADCPHATAFFHYGPGGGAATEREVFASVQDAKGQTACSAGTIRPLGNDSGELLYSATRIGADGKPSGTEQLAIGPDMHFHPYAGPQTEEPKDAEASAYRVSEDGASIVVTEGKNRFRLPVADRSADTGAGGVSNRRIREVVTERFLLNAGGSLFVLPRPTAGGARRIKPVCTHDKRISDFCSWRGLLVLAGNRADAHPDGHYVAANDGTGLWFGDIDDLWKLGAPRGHGGPWLNTEVSAGTPSDPYLMAGYDHKTIEFSHDAPGKVRLTVEVDPAGNGSWQVFREFEVPAGETVRYEFPSGYNAQWVRVRSDTACRATAQLDYQ